MRLLRRTLACAALTMLGTTMTTPVTALATVGLAGKINREIPVFDNPVVDINGDPVVPWKDILYEGTDVTVFCKERPGGEQARDTNLYYRIAYSYLSGYRYYTGVGDVKYWSVTVPGMSESELLGRVQPCPGR
jgi:hypothetical protein